MPLIENKDPLIERILGGRYRLLRRISQGGFGAIYEAADTNLPREVVVKVLRPHLQEQPQEVERFRREAMIISKLSHPHALKIYECGEAEDGVVWIAMEKLTGQTLAQHLEQHQKLSEQEARTLLRHVCEVLEEAHQRGIIHRDLTPKNLFLVPVLDGGFVTKILDFGLASFHETPGMTATTEVSGSPPYMAPEQWDGLKKAEARSDLYALGVIVYQCLAGRLPFEADSLYSWLKKHKEEAAPRLPKSVSSAVQETIARALEKDPRHRPRSAADMLVMLDARPKKRALFFFVGGAAASALALTVSLWAGQGPIPPREEPSFIQSTTSISATQPKTIAHQGATSQAKTAPSTKEAATQEAEKKLPSKVKPKEQPRSVPSTQMLLDGMLVEPFKGR